MRASAGLPCAGLARSAPQSVLDPEIAGQSGDVAALFRRQERDADAAAACAAGSPDAVRVGVAVLGRVVVDHMRDPIDVDPARRDIRCDERRDVS